MGLGNIGLGNTGFGNMGVGNIRLSDTGLENFVSKCTASEACHFCHGAEPNIKVIIMAATKHWQQAKLVFLPLCT